ncbi:MAG: TQO small subunit DoxD [Planctomycetota bacterium]
MEGSTKLRDGKFDARYFLIDAKGPLAPVFRSIVRDVDGRERMCIKETELDDGSTKVEFDPEITFLLWEDFLNRAFEEYEFGSEKLREEIAEQREELADQIREARQEQNTRIDTSELEAQRDRLEQDSIAIRDQAANAEAILLQHQDALTQWLAGNRVELVAFYQTDDRLTGFERDGSNRGNVASGVESLRWQVDEIKKDRLTELNGWKSEVEAIWDSFEGQINDLATEQQKAGGTIKVHRPYDQDVSNLKVINRIIPWFDTIVGVLLIVGLFTRFASIAGAGFLASVVATQPPWVADAAPTYYQSIELFALLVIFATCAGRCGGLDYFLHSASKDGADPQAPSHPDSQESQAESS